MNIKSKLILDEYREQKSLFKELEEIVYSMLSSVLDDSGIRVFYIEHRVKEENSLAGKLELKGDKYSSLDDVTDILGARVICFFSDDVDRVVELMNKMFRVDMNNSVDKRNKNDPKYFGYQSVHYICQLPNNGIYPSELCDKKFEIQIRSSLQHTWAAINHDLGYKTEFGIPKAVEHELSRVSGLLEIADQQFVAIRDSVERYSENIKNRICSGDVKNIPIDSVSLSEYVKNNYLIVSLNNEIADICGAKINFVSPENYIYQLQFLGKSNLEQLHYMIEKNYSLALELAKRYIGQSEPELVSSNVALRFVCRAELLISSYTREQSARFLNISIGDIQRAKRSASNLFDIYDEINQKD